MGVRGREWGNKVKLTSQTLSATNTDHGKRRFGRETGERRYQNLIPDGEVGFRLDMHGSRGKNANQGRKIEKERGSCC